MYAEHGLQVSFDDFKEFASLRKELHDLQVAVEFYQKTTGHFGLSDLKVSCAAVFSVSTAYLDPEHYCQATLPVLRHS